MILKEVSLLNRPADGIKDHFDLSQRRELQIKQVPPRSLIHFTCKSELDRFMRLSKMVLSLSTITAEEI